MRIVDLLVVIFFIKLKNFTRNYGHDVEKKNRYLIFIWSFPRSFRKVLLVNEKGYKRFFYLFQIKTQIIPEE